MHFDFFIPALCFTFVLGLVMGSFLNCWARRIVHGESIIRGRSHCTSCNHVLSAADLVPVLSWLALRGTCRYCGARISVRYPLVELFCALIYTSLVACYGLTLETLELACFASVLLVLSLTDIDVYLIPNACVVTAAVVRLCYLAVAGALGELDFSEAAVAALVGGVAIAGPLLVFVLIADILLHRPSMGGGDIKLIFVAGLYFGWQQCLVLIAIACALGLVTAFIGARLQKDAEESVALKTIPFGPSIAVACWIMMLCGNALSALVW